MLGLIQQEVCIHPTTSSANLFSCFVSESSQVAPGISAGRAKHLNSISLRDILLEKGKKLELDIDMRMGGVVLLEVCGLSAFLVFFLNQLYICSNSTRFLFRMQC